MKWKGPTIEKDPLTPAAKPTRPPLHSPARRKFGHSSCDSRSKSNSCFLRKRCHVSKLLLAVVSVISCEVGGKAACHNQGAAKSHDIPTPEKRGLQGRSHVVQPSTRTHTGSCDVTFRKSVGSAKGNTVPEDTGPDCGSATLRSSCGVLVRC